MMVKSVLIVGGGMRMDSIATLTQSKDLQRFLGELAAKPPLIAPDTGRQCTAQAAGGRVTA